MFLEPAKILHAFPSNWDSYEADDNWRSAPLRRGQKSARRRLRVVFVLVV